MTMQDWQVPLNEKLLLYFNNTVTMKNTKLTFTVNWWQSDGYETNGAAIQFHLDLSHIHKFRLIIGQ
jgi:hypothetical protein